MRYPRRYAGQNRGGYTQRGGPLRQNPGFCSRCGDPAYKTEDDEDFVCSRCLMWTPEDDERTNPVFPSSYTCPSCQRQQRGIIDVYFEDEPSFEEDFAENPERWQLFPHQCDGGRCACPGVHETRGQGGWGGL